MAAKSRFLPSIALNAEEDWPLLSGSAFGERATLWDVVKGWLFPASALDVDGQRNSEIHSRPNLKWSRKDSNKRSGPRILGYRGDLWENRFQLTVQSLTVHQCHLVLGDRWRLEAR
jgi:hypothetical protein